MEFVDSIPTPPSGRSEEDIAKIRSRAGQWGVIAAGKLGDQVVYNAEQRLRMYVRAHNLPVEVRRRTDKKGVTRIYAAWEPAQPLDDRDRSNGST